MTPSPQASPARRVQEIPGRVRHGYRIPHATTARMNRRDPSAPQSRPSTTHPRGDFHA